ncbi:MAG: hemerythrin domain-containing protein [Comamonadaceae bacterium]|nr:hemerythrin domain-containing protein [Burkholderiales bacterium]MEB2349008.1 hemerythrin domain-containing protein [Comamonadaceae bacterium]
MSTDHRSDTPDYEDPLSNFVDCHGGILSHLHTFGELPALLEPAARARTIAAQTIEFFNSTVFAHHIDEEKELFPAVLAKALPGDERATVQRYVDRLVAEHRHVEAIWRDLEPHLQKIARGQAHERLDPEAITRLVKSYEAHARTEENEFLPLSAKILRREGADMGGLGLSLHLRHAVRAARRGLRGS